MIETPKVGQVFQNRYLILAELGKGGSGLVFKANQVDVDRVVAIKTLRAEKRGDSETVARFFREFRLLSTLSHPHIMTVYGVSLDDDSSPYAICEYIDGTNLRKHVYSRVLSWEQVADIAIQIAIACQYAHDQGVIHRDLKPDNVILQDKPSERFVKILDFGLSKAFINAPADEKLTMTGQLIGTPHYMSPEQAGMKADARTDIYALGCIIFELLTGEHLFDADSSVGVIYKQINDDVQERIATIESKMPQRFFAALSQMLEKDPQMRFQSMSDLEEELKTILKQPDNLITGKSWKQFSDKVRTNKSKLKSSLIFGAVAILLLNCVLFLFLSFQSRDAQSSKPAELREKSLAEIKQLESIGDYRAALEKYVELIKAPGIDEIDKCSLFFRADDCVSTAIFLNTQSMTDKKVGENALFVSNGAIECAEHKHDLGQFSRGLAVKYKSLKLLEAKEAEGFWAESCKLTDKVWGAKSKAAFQIRSVASLEYMNEGNIDAAANVIQECMQMLDSDLPVDADKAVFVKCSWIFILHKRGQDTEALVRLKECDQDFLQMKNVDVSKRRALMERLLNNHNLLNQLDSFEDLLAQEFKENALLYQPEPKSKERNTVTRSGSADVPALMYLLLAMRYSGKERHAEALSSYKIALSKFDATEETRADRYYCLVRMRREALNLGKNQEAKEYQARITKMIKADPALVKYTRLSSDQ